MKKGSFHHSKETKLKMSIARSGSGNGFYGHKHNQKSKEKMSQTIKTVWANPESIFHSKEYRNKLMGNTNFKTFLKSMSPEKKESWLVGYRQKISKQHTPERKAIARMRMEGNTFVSDYLLKNPVWSQPDWSNYTPHLSVPSFVPIIQRLTPPQQVGYYCSGLIPCGLL